MSEDRTSAQVFTIAPGVSFLDALARAVLDGAFAGGSSGQTLAPHDPLALGDTTILLPTRRACRQLSEAFLTASERDALLLPTIRPIGEANEDVALLDSVIGREGRASAGDLPDAIGELERRLVLAMLVMRWSEALRGDAAQSGGLTNPAAGARTPAQAMHLARELARLIDMVENENASLAQLEDLVPDTLSEHWQQTIQFLDIITKWWPAQLEAAGQLSPANRRNRLILGEAKRHRIAERRGPVIVAGVTGSIPATAELIKAVLSREDGAVVLPGLDTGMEDEAWAQLGRENPEHPQHALATLLKRLDVERREVQTLAGAEPGDALSMRETLVNEAMRPAGSTDQWHQLGERVARDAALEAFAAVNLLTAPSAQDEAEAIALIMREAAETPGRTAALVSPDRLLARRVAVRLESWGIRVDDSAGRPFAKTVPGAFLDLVIEVFRQNFAPAALMALLKHPLARIGRPVLDIRRAARALEVAAFRAPYIGNGLEGVRAQLERQAQQIAEGDRRDRAGHRLRPEDWEAVHGVVDDLEQAFAPLAALKDAGTAHALADLAAAHIATGEALARLPDVAPSDEEAAPSDGEETTESELWRDEAGHAAAHLFAYLVDRKLPAPDVRADDYPDFYRALVAGEAVRSLIPVHPRLAIWGPFEARLQRPDIVILGSLNEGTWPEAADPGPWLNRPMRQKLGLPQPEERIGYAGHDVTQLAGADKVYLTRAEKVDGNPTVPSRWLMRLDAVLQAVGAADALGTNEAWLSWARQRDAGGPSVPPRQPEPRPPLDMRPRRLSVSAIETWISNPYAIFAQRILKLDALPQLGLAPGANLRGTIVHAALGRFAARFPNQLPEDIQGELMMIARDEFAAYKSHPRIEAFWMQRFERFAEWFAETEAARRGAGSETLRDVSSEIDGKLVFATGDENFTLTARADRIDTGPDGIWITDYKTAANLDGLVRAAKENRSPQLPLEAAIAIADGFTGIEGLPVKGLRYISASGGEPAGLEKDVIVDDIAGAATRALDELKALVARFDQPETPYRAVRRAHFRYDYDAYAQLARVAEWASADQDAGEG
jgi:ATP-dependent helicase/nuclease subunit B